MDDLTSLNYIQAEKDAKLSTHSNLARCYLDLHERVFGPIKSMMPCDRHKDLPMTVAITGVARTIVPYCPECQKQLSSTSKTADSYSMSILAGGPPHV